MKQQITEAIVLTRTDYGEADRVITLLTPDHGKLRLMAKGVRRVKSKLAGGIELFSVSTITFVQGRGGIGTLISSRLLKHYGRIVQDLDRTMAGYDLIKRLHTVTEDQPEPEYFTLLSQTFESLDNHSLSLPIIRFWFDCQLLRLGGHTPNLQTDVRGNKLDAKKVYNFDFETMAFVPFDHGSHRADHIKFLRLSFAGHTPKVLGQVKNSEQLLMVTAPLVATISQDILQ
ncbi:MAG TPA: DNA repair protein RecO [Candidatus Saccharimonadales bacterium]|nr:DNA repair protein RecO [Candidatus Saccharimonadales bacterium]